MSQGKKTRAAHGIKFPIDDKFRVDGSTFVFGLFVDQSHVAVAGRQSLSEADLVEAFKLITAGVSTTLGQERTEEICRAALFEKV